MGLTWKDGVTTLLAVAVAVVYQALASGWAVPVVGDARGASLVLGIVGLAMCIIGADATAMTTRDRATVTASILGGAAAVLTIGALITGWPTLALLLAADILLLWIVSTLRHAIGTSRSATPA